MQSIPTCVSVSKMMRSIEVRSNLDNSPVNQEEFPTPASRCPVPDWCGMSALWVGRCWSVSTSSWLFGTGWAGEILGSGGWYSGPCIVGGENVGNKRLVIWCQTRRMKKKREPSSLRFLMKIFESVEASQGCRPTKLCNAIFQGAENSSLLGYYVLATVTKLPAFRRIVKPLSSRESSVNWHINGIILRLRKLRVSRL